MELKVGDSFNNWNEIQAAVDSFAKKNGFVAIKILIQLTSLLFVDVAIIAKRLEFISLGLELDVCDYYHILMVRFDVYY